MPVLPRRYNFKLGFCPGSWDQFVAPEGVDAGQDGRKLGFGAGKIHPKAVPKGRRQTDKCSFRQIRGRDRQATPFQARHLHPRPPHSVPAAILQAEHHPGAQSVYLPPIDPPVITFPQKHPARYRGGIRTGKQAVG